MLYRYQTAQSTGIQYLMPRQSKAIRVSDKRFSQLSDRFLHNERRTTVKIVLFLITSTILIQWVIHWNRTQFLAIKLLSMHLDKVHSWLFKQGWIDNFQLIFLSIRRSAMQAGKHLNYSNKKQNFLRYKKIQIQRNNSNNNNNSFHRLKL